MLVQWSVGHAAAALPLEHKILSVHVEAGRHKSRRNLTQRQRPLPPALAGILLYCGTASEAALTSTEYMRCV